MSGADKRVFPRFDVKATVEIVRADGKVLRCMSRNVSKGGVCLDARTALAGGELVDLHVRLVFDANRTSEPLALPARVMWCTAIGDTHQVGTQFLQLSQEQNTYLDLFLRYLDDAARARADAEEDDEPADDDPFA
jgi:hypothetical protein